MSPRYSTKRSDHIEYEFWLVFDAAGGMRLTRAQPGIERGERAMSCTAKLPLSLFSTPTLRATIGIAEGVPASFDIDVSAVSEAIKNVVGVDVDLRIVGGDEP